LYIVGEVLWVGVRLVLARYLLLPCQGKPTYLIEINDNSIISGWRRMTPSMELEHFGRLKRLESSGNLSTVNINLDHRFQRV
jgi:hypothetical protein